MGQRYEGTIIVQTPDQYSPTGDYTLIYQHEGATEEQVLEGYTAFNSDGKLLQGIAQMGGQGGEDNPILGNSEAEMNALLTVENIGKFAKYAGPEISRRPVANGLVTDEMANIVFDQTISEDDMMAIYAMNDADKHFTFTSNGGTDVYSIKFEQLTLKGGVAKVLDLYKGDVLEYVLYSDVQGANDEGLTVAKGWNRKAVNADGKLIVFSYNKTWPITAYDFEADADALIKLEPYGSTESYEIVQGEGEIYFEERYFLEPLAGSDKAQLTADEVPVGKWFYDWTGTLNQGTKTE